MMTMLTIKVISLKNRINMLESLKKRMSFLPISMTMKVPTMKQLEKLNMKKDMLDGDKILIMSL